MTKIKVQYTALVFLSFFMICCGNSVSTSNASVNPPVSKADQIDELINAYVAEGKFNGSVLVANNGEAIYKKGFGLANIEWDVPNAPDTKHRIASITKQFTAMLILQLVAEKKLDLHIPISTYLPDHPKEQAEHVSVHQLLSHTSGIPDYGRFSNYRSFERNRHRPQEIVDLFANLPLDSTPGEEYSYCNSGYVLLGIIIEKITQKSYGDVLREKIFDPLGMDDTGYDYQWEIVKKKSVGYYKIWNQYRNMNFLDMSLPYAAGGLYSTVDDLHLWDQALYTEELLPQEYLDLMFEKHVPTRGRHYGYGWFVSDLTIGSTDEQVESLSHGGGMDGYRSLITRIPYTRSTVTLLSNTEGVELRAITIAIVGILNDQPYDFPDKSMAFALQRIIESEGVEKAMNFFDEFKNDESYYLAEQDLVIVGYELLGKDRAEGAASVFELGIQEFPDAFNVYDSYGEVLMVLGEKDKAIINYQKSIELNPDNENGKQKLRELGVVD